MQTYLVGGAVRDRLLGLPVKDKDWVVVGSTAAEMVDLGYKPVGADFPVFLHPVTNEEYALARTERKTGSGYHGFEFHASPDVTLEEDLQRRDLTINAIAEDTEGRLIDPWNGEDDIRSRTLRHVSQAFTEDPVRVLRIARLSARFKPLDFSIAEETLALMRAMVSDGEVDSLVAERVWQELDNSLTHADARVFFETLRHCGALSRILPELDGLFGTPEGAPQQAQGQVETNIGVHTMMCLDQVCKLTDDRSTRFSVTCHELGAEMTKTLCDRLRAPKNYRSLATLVARYHTSVHRGSELSAQTLTDTLTALDVVRKPERFEQFLLACIADARTGLNPEDGDYPQASYFKHAAEAYLGIDAAKIAKNAAPTQIAESIHQARVAAVSAFIENQS